MVPVDDWKTSPGYKSKLNAIIELAEEQHQIADKLKISDEDLRRKIAELTAQKPKRLPTRSLAYASREYRLLKPRDFIKKLLSHYLPEYYKDLDHTRETQELILKEFCKKFPMAENQEVLNGFAANLEGKFNPPYKDSGFEDCPALARHAMELYNKTNDHPIGVNDAELNIFLESDPIDSRSPATLSTVDYAFHPYYAWKNNRLDANKSIDSESARDRLRKWAHVSGEFSVLGKAQIQYVNLEDYLHKQLRKIPKQRDPLMFCPQSVALTC